ncbi:uncharacterized protein LOC131287206 [Anopheles ziemanni]|uniref:uncharacterized protein LOC131259958 n=1 Tax=Anopheles coustani TaxID=139045 RepID=UPI002657E2EA|nr:uncharacterized protein LOC131259958 [Anopheles coustani]XP_058172219.1 uncharacterized protein LOC131287206 [Anopheles ziemanni]
MLHKIALVTVLAAFACQQLVLSTKVAEVPEAVKQVLGPRADGNLLLEFDSLFNRLHYDVDYKLRVLRMNQSLAIKNLNAQFISRFGIVITDIQTEKLRVKDLILQHALEIGDTQNPCIVAQNDEALRQATQAAADISLAAELAYADMATASRVFFYPQVQAFQNSSTDLQSAVVEKLSRSNIVTDLDIVLAELAYQYEAEENKVERVIAGIEQELANFQEVVNNVRRDIWAMSDTIGRNFVFNMGLLLEEALQCS